MTRITILGGNGMLGTELTKLLPDNNCVSLNRNECDITDLQDVELAIKKSDYVINCAAWTAVDDAEDFEGAAFAVNATGARNVAIACKEINSKLIHISTDYVFSGESDKPYLESSPTNPKTAYGRTKLAGEEEVISILPSSSYIVRTAWLYGEYGSNFIKTILKLEKQNSELSIVNDQIGQPTWSRSVGKQILKLIDASAPFGIYHATSTGQTTWYGLAVKVFELIGEDPHRIRPVTSDAYVRPAKRPKYSVLGHKAWEKAGIQPIPNWELELAEAFQSGAFELER